jgi:hypothetical protein
MFLDTCRYVHFYLFWYVELVPKGCHQLSVTPNKHSLTQTLYGRGGTHVVVQ